MQTFVIEFMPSFVILIQYVSICKSDLTSYLGKKLYVFFRVALFYVIFFSNTKICALHRRREFFTLHFEAIIYKNALFLTLNVQPGNKFTFIPKKSVYNSM
jgi:hypothetical protein